MHYVSPILCVDDEPNNLAVLRQTLQDEYKLVFARNGEDALRMVNKHGPSLILLDIQMPGMDGYEVCRQLKSDPATEEIPVIFVTALTDKVNERRGFDCGCVDYVTKPISPPVVQARVKTHLSLVRNVRLERSYRDAIYMLGLASHYKDKDGSQGAHIHRMAAYSRVLANKLGWSAEHCEVIELAAAMHDTGKIGIPDEILKNTRMLSAEESKIMQSHTEIGFEILRQSEAPLFQLAAQIALYHHERWDGSGYPMGLAGEAIPESARIVAVADVFDALSMRRSYKEAWPLNQVLKFLQDSAGAHFEPRIVQAFMEALPDILKIKRDWESRDSTTDS